MLRRDTLTRFTVVEDFWNVPPFGDEHTGQIILSNSSVSGDYIDLRARAVAYDDEEAGGLIRRGDIFQDVLTPTHVQFNNAGQGSLIFTVVTGSQLG